MSASLAAAGDRDEAPVPVAAASIRYGHDILPILANRCFKCHGPDDAARQAGLRLDTAAGARAGGRSGQAAIVPGDALSSPLLARITSNDPDFRMPPPEVGRGLDEASIALIRQWIDEGATYEPLWSLVPPSRPALPQVKKRGWPRTGIDHFVLAQLESRGMAPSPEADRATLLRRVTLDLTGLPPAPEEVAAFLADDSPDAYERAVDRLLDSPHFGERWARVWLDLARYADTKGYEADRRRTMWPWRDWVIRAINDDLPFDRFTIEQLAGDLLPEPSRDQILATAFHRNTMTNDEGGTTDEEFRAAAVVDRVNTTMQVWTGLTAGCAQCHAHKYDPIGHEEYYGLYAFFNNTADADQMDDAPLLALATPEQESARAAVEARIAALEAEIRAAEAPPVIIEENDDDPLSATREALKQAQAERGRIVASIPHVPVLRELPEQDRRVTHVHERGNFMSEGAAVTPGVPAALPRVEGEGEGELDRLDLARWLVSPDHPLTARITVNRHWEVLFGTGIVETSEDFGVQGSRPSHPELLDWLATEFIAQDWSRKALVRLIVTSATYRQSARATSEARERDPYNRWLGRGPRFRLDAETIRDQALAASGLLNRQMYGPPVFPPQPEGVWQIIYSNDQWTEASGPDRHRRALYTFWRRTSPYPSMITFDAPSRETCVSRRIRTNTPLQALVLLNDPVYVEAAQALARRVVRESGPAIEVRTAYALSLCLARPARDDEVALLAALYKDELAHFRAHPQAARAAAEVPLGPLPAGLDPPALAAWTVVSGTILNLDEFVTRP